MFASIPRQFESITPTWLTGCLHEAGTITDAAVTDVRVEPLGIGVGFLGQLARLHLTYDRPTAGPRTLIGKLPTLDPGGRQICQLFKFYERSIGYIKA